MPEHLLFDFGQVARPSQYRATPPIFSPVYGDELNALASRQRFYNLQDVVSDLFDAGG